MDTKTINLHVVFLPFMAAGHILPILDIAKVFATRHIKTTVITTPLNASKFLKSLESYTNPNFPPIDVKIIPFPSKAAGYPEGIENIEHFTTAQEMQNFLMGCEKLEESVEQVLKKLNPTCLVSDFMFSFAARVAAKFNIPNLVFHGTSFIARCAYHSIWGGASDAPKSFSPNEREFIILNVPHELKLKRSQAPSDAVDKVTDFDARAAESEAKSYGVIINSFYELEPDYVHHYRNVLGKRAWHIGPVSLLQRGKESSINDHDYECLKWLDSKKPNSVVYICFGSLAVFTASQLGEIMAALEASRHDFLWVVGKIIKDEGSEELINGFGVRMKGKGLILRDWAPQRAILDHESIGAFVTHCGWNSILEGVSCGVPMVTWPIFAEQPVNEKLVTEILKVGVAVGAKEWSVTVKGDVKRESIKEAIERVMVGREALEMKSKAEKLKIMARKAVEKGGSSYSDLTTLIQELSSYNNAM